MQPVYKCDYCSKIDTEEKIKEHEPVCHENYDRKNCYTCVHKKFSCKQNGTQANSKTWVFECKAGEEIPEGRIVELCPKYERKIVINDSLENIFGNMFGSI